ncbi:hypothetical protein BFF78_13450 [Streptomyces fodineus]|uniref:Uncharacterized protein n=1 Tax=Streptomyces fodineus TaxID=1904616 RepID=A0A1D7Y8M8_9ACTN|nr:hypothetical protein [Streptomyces fodineus]AOR31921.1 hypothetical protein BFF78_13450 [Streptomyces fodineus]
MDVLLCAACGHRPTDPVRLLAEIPEPCGWDGLAGSAGLRRPAASMPRGTYAVDPLPHAHPDVMRGIGCCGPDGEHGVNRVRVCGAQAAIAAADCTSEYATRFVPDAVRRVPA